MSRVFIPLHVECTGHVRVAAPLRKAIALFTPQGERTWVPGWSPEYLYPPDGTDCDGAVFRTVTGGEETLWMIGRLDPLQCVAEYVRVTPGSRMGTVSIHGEAVGDATLIHVTYRLTALSDSGNQALVSFRSGFEGMLREWEAAIERQGKEQQ